MAIRKTNWNEKKFLFVLFVILAIQNIYAQNEENKEDRKDIEPLLELSFFRFVFPALNEPKLMDFFGWGFGLHKEIIPKYFLPGIFIDAGLGYDWGIIFDSSKDIDKDKKLEQLGFIFGIRLYNLMELGVFNIHTFFGYNFILGQLDPRVSKIIHNPIVGIKILLYFIGLEYAYYIPTKYSDNTGFHHISLVCTFTNNSMKKFSEIEW